MTKILAFDSMYIANPFRKAYTALIRKLLNDNETNTRSLILYRLDQDNVFIRDRRNVSGISIGVHQEKVDAKSIQFYRYLGKFDNRNTLSIKNLDLYKLYNRQVKLKLAGALKCAYRVKNLSSASEDKLEIIADRQTVSIIKEALIFLGYSPSNISWKVNGWLTACITINSLCMRFAAVIKMVISSSTLPKQYYYKNVDTNALTVLLAMPRRRPEDFFSTYVEQLGKEFNIVLYSHGFMKHVPENYKVRKIKRRPGIIKGLFNIKNICWNVDSYIADIIIIFKNHFNLNISIDVVDSVFSNKIDILINRQQTNVVDNYLAIKAKEKDIFILGDLFEEIFYCDSAICSSESQHTESFGLALNKNGKVTYKGSNSLINYRLKNFDKKKEHYLHQLLKVSIQKKIIFYASDPSKEERQRYLTEKFLIHYFSSLQDTILVMKTHTQDKGMITNYAFTDSGSPSNVILIGDIRQKGKMASKQFIQFEDFDFNAAISSSDGFLTTSSTSILQALVLGTKSGIVDKFDNGFFDYLIDHKASSLINDEESLRYFLENENFIISDTILSYCGLKNVNDNDEFNMQKHISECLSKKDRNTQKPI